MWGVGGDGGGGGGAYCEFISDIAWQDIKMTFSWFSLI